MAKTKLHWKFTLGVLTLALIGWVTAAHAVPTLQISDGSTTVTVVDNGVGDLNPLVGVVTFAGSFPGLIVTVDTGVSKPVMPFPGAIDLNAIQIAPGAKDFTIKFSDTDFVFPTGATSLIMTLGGTLSVPGCRPEARSRSTATKTTRTRCLAQAAFMSARRRSVRAPSAPR
jgi:hypothetical protein